MWWLLIAGCDAPDPGQGDPADPGTADTADPASFPWPDPAWDAQGVAAAFDAVTAAGLPDPRTMRDAFAALFAHGDARCPQAQGYNLLSFTGCTAESGWTFAGYSVYQDGGPQGFLLASDAYFLDPDGQQFSAAGQIIYQIQGDRAVIGMDGTWGYPPAGGWFGEVPSLNLSGSLSPDGGDLSGGLTLRDPGSDPDTDPGTGGARSLYFEQLRWSGGCFEGGARVRDPSGLWYALAFEEGCTGCAAVTWGGEQAPRDLGRACPDLAPFEELATRVAP